MGRASVSQENACGSRVKTSSCRRTLRAGNLAWRYETRRDEDAACFDVDRSDAGGDHRQRLAARELNNVVRDTGLHG
jgi:hypothetical protein